MPRERKLSIKEPKALVILLVLIQRGELSVVKVEVEGNILLFDMAVFHLWLHEEHFGVSNTGKGYMGVKHWICQSRISLCFLLFESINNCAVTSS